MTLGDALSHALNDWREIISTAETGEPRLRLFEDAAAEVAKFVGRGFNGTEIGDRLDNLAVQAGIEDIDGRQRTIAAAIQRAANASAFRQSSAQFVADFVPPDYLLDGVLIRRYLYSFTGRTGSGKTAVTLLLAACIALGRLYGGREVSRGCVFYLCGENPDDVRMRWIALAKELGFDPETIDVHFFPKRFLISEKYAELAAEAQVVGGVALVIVDTSQAYFEGDNFNDNVQQLKHAQRLRTLTELHGGPTVVVNSHPVKNAPLDNLIPCGGGNFLNEVDGNLTCALNGVVIDVGWQGKFRGPDFSLTFRVRTVNHERLKDSRGRLMPTVIAEHLSESAEREIAAAARNHEDRLLAELAKDGRASYAEYARRCGWTYQSGEPNRSSVQRTIGRLKELKLITQDDRDGFALTKKGQEALKSIPANGKANGNIHGSLKVVGDCPQDAACAFCREGGNGKKGIVQNIALNRPNATPLPLHRKCAEQWFHVRDDTRTRGRGRYPRN
jgi:hypothetical protein